MVYLTYLMKQLSRQARNELIIIGAVALVIAILELYVDSLQRLVIWATANDSLLVTEILSLAIVLAVGMGIYAFRRWRESVALAADRVELQQTTTLAQDARRLLQSYAEAVTRGQEAERRRLARELHDDTIQQLILLNQRVELVAYDYAESAAAADLHDMQLVIDGIITNVRRFIQELRPPYLDELGLVTALRTLIKQTRERTDLLIEFDVKGSSHRLSEAIELALFRIAQTALTNVIQHAEASQVEVTLDFGPSCIALTITDDGCGFIPEDENRLVQDGHFGLIGMRERAQLLGASFSVNSNPAEGTTIAVSVPRTQL